MFWVKKNSSKENTSSEQPKTSAIVSPATGLKYNCTTEQRQALNIFQDTYTPQLCIPKSPPNNAKNSTTFTSRYDDETIFLRFLRARQFDMKKTCEMFDNDLKWRTEYRVEEMSPIPLDYSQHVRKHYPHGYHGTDRIGRPVFIDCIGKAHISTCLKEVTADEMLDLYTQEYETLLEIILPSCSVAAGRSIEQTTTIVDLSGLGFGHFSKATHGIFKRLSVMSQDHYPETLGQMVVVNAPPAFSQMWTLIKGMIDENTVRKITIFSSRSTSWKSKLAEIVSPDQLPVFLGGTKEVENWTNSTFGPWSEAKNLKAVLKKRPYVRSLLAVFVNEVDPSSELFKAVGIESSKLKPRRIRVGTNQKQTEGNDSEKANDAVECVLDSDKEAEEFLSSLTTLTNQPTPTDNIYSDD